MKDKEIEDSTEEFEKLLQLTGKEKYVLRLYIAGMTPKSSQAVMNIKRICEEKLKGRYELEVIDISQDPKSIRDEEIVATPTLIKKLPLPIRKIIGDMVKTERILIALNLVSKEKE